MIQRILLIKSVALMKMKKILAHTVCYWDQEWTKTGMAVKHRTILFTIAFWVTVPLLKKLLWVIMRRIVIHIFLTQMNIFMKMHCRHMPMIRYISSWSMHISTRKTFPTN